MFVPREMTLSAFLDEAAAEAPVPGGGGIAALAGALAASMAEMSLNFTVGKKKFAAVEQRARELLSAVNRDRQGFLELVAADARAYGAVSEALKLPRSTDEEKAARREALKAAMRRALEPPLEIVRALGRLGAALPEILEISNPNLAGDVAVSAALAPACARAAALNVWANISSLDDEAAGEVYAEVAGVITDLDNVSKSIVAKVESKLCPSPGPGRT